MGLSIATRPDCINDEIAKLLHSYCKKYYVCVELGLQTANEQTGKAINRCYTNSDFTNAVEILNTYGIDVITHIMVGLPNETQKDVLDTVKFINSHNVKGVKIHSTYVIKNTKLAVLLENGNYKALEMDEYIETLAKIITHLRDDIIIHRITGDAPKNILIAPLWNTHKKLVLNAFEKYMKENDLFQGIMC